MKSKHFINDIKNLSASELAVKKVALKEELMKLRFKGAVGQLEKNHMVRQVRRDIARVETVISAAGKKTGK